MKQYLVKPKDAADRKRLVEEYAYLDYILMPKGNYLAVIKQKAKKKKKDKKEKEVRDKRTDKYKDDE